LSWREFEMLVGEAFPRKGFQVRETRDGPDQGLDLELRKGTELHLVQCKQWRAHKVGVSIVSELYGVMAACGAAGGFVVTSGVYTKDAEAFAAGRNIALVGGDRLHAMLETARAAIPKQTRSEHDEVDARRSLSTPRREAAQGTEPPPTVPVCPNCGGAMVRRVARRGANQGSSSWGCQAYPRCKGTLPG